MCNRIQFSFPDCKEFLPIIQSPVRLQAGEIPLQQKNTVEIKLPYSRGVDQMIKLITYAPVTAPLANPPLPGG